MHQRRILREKAFAFLLFTCFLWFMSFTTRAIFSPLLPLMEDEFAVGHARASSIFIFLSVGYTLSLAFSGLFARLLGPKKSIVASMVLAAFAYSMIPLFRVFYLLYFSTFLVGVSVGMYLPSMIPLLTARHDEKDWGKVLAIHDSGAGISLFAAPLIVTGLLALMPWRGIFLVMAAILLVCAVVFFVVTEEGRAFSGRKQSLFLTTMWRRRELWFMATVMIFIAGAGIGFYYIIPLYLVKELRMAPGRANSILGISRAISVAAGISTGFIVDRFSLKKTMFFLALGSGLLTMLLATKDLVWIEILLFIQPCLTMSFMPAMFVALSRLFQGESRGQATGVLLSLGAIVGGGVIPYLIGLSGDLVSFRLGIFLLGAVTALSSGLIPILKGLRW